ncbi:hypothetical protein ACYVLC_003437 [Vibrio cholerae]|uniref:hypothetical protein n=1 Tax=Vibrio TaxID=662 RepID=UPI0006D7FA83|nr:MULTISPECIES: hypothetical protein [Vibrio]EJL6684721.1 hypothetical protein [Vibrio cholerae]EKF9299206.1 hypothetical protein [Vibrio cholerae]MBO1386712.1 hypothetical protein [Vibrio cholerae]MCX9469119.1 hypothetical protein [Vibrio cholerae]QKU72457.1 hypothetical protein HPY09_16305 [Vibrio cholerae]
MERIGLLITILWSCLVAILIGFKWPEAIQMPLNEWGDFLAGITAPIAFLWLIIGYMLQRKELNLNTEALTLSKNEIQRQANELEQQTEYQKIQAQAAREQSREINRRRHEERRKSMLARRNQREEVAEE